MFRRLSVAALNSEEPVAGADPGARVVLEMRRAPLARARRSARLSRAALASLEALETRLLFAISNYALSAPVSLDNSTATYAGLAIDSSGNLFGTAPSGGASGNGSVFEVPAGGTATQTIATFNGANGSSPQSRLVIDSAGNLYGTTRSGGDNGFGTVFELVKNSDGTYGVTTLASFTGFAGNGAGPLGALALDANGNLYGVTDAQPAGDTVNTPGPASGGTVFELGAGTNTLTTIGSFSQAGSAPESGLAVDTAGNVYGAMSGELNDGSTSDAGTVFELVKGTDGSYTQATLAAFDGTTNGSVPLGNLTIDASGNLFGVTAFGGATNSGTVFEIPANSGAPATIQTLASFGTGTGIYPSGGLFVGVSGDVFGTTYAGGNNDDGTVYELPAGSGTVTTLASFNAGSAIGPNTGGAPNPGLVQDAGGNFFGTTGYGGSSADLDGTVFELSPATVNLPVASISSSPVTVPGTTPESVTVTYTDPDGINLSSINAGNLSVTDPQGNPLTVEPTISLTQVNNPSGGPPMKVTVVYTVDPPAGGWTMSNNGDYNVTASGVFDASSTYSVLPTKGTFRVGIGTGPTVTITAPDVTTPGNHYSQITLTFSDPAGVSLLSVASLQQKLIVTGPASLGSPRLALQDQNTTPPLGGGGQTQKVTVTYDIAAPFVSNGAPKGDWFVGDNGTYTISLPAGVVTDSSGTFSNAARTITFKAAVPDNPPTATFMTPAPVTKAAATTTITVTYTGAQDIDPTTINTNNITVVGPNNNVLAVTGVSTDDPGKVPVPKVTVTYTVSAPAGFGAFTSDLNGAYGVTLNANQSVKDVARRAATAKSGTDFIVDVPPPNAPATFQGGGDARLGFTAQDATPAGKGKILVVGYQSAASGGGSDAVLEQLTATGDADPTFGTGGKAILPNARFYGVSLGSDGKIYATGTTSGGVLLAAFNPDGTPVSSFGNNGRVVTSVSGAPNAVFYSVAIDPNNGDVVAGGGANGKFLLDRFTPTGQPDPTFNAGAPLVFSDGGSDVLGQVAVQPGGSAIVAAGAGGASGASVVVTRVTAAGAKDTSFGNGGFAVVSALATLGQVGSRLDHTEGLAIDPTSGKIVVANSTATGDFGVARLTPDGAVDSSWGTGGLVTSDFNHGGRDDADAVVIQPDGSQVFVVGTTKDNLGTVQTAVVALTPTGAPDPTFGTKGQETFSPVVGAAAGSAGASIARPAGGPRVARPDAVNLSSILMMAFAGLNSGNLIVGSNNAVGGGKVRPLIVANPPPAVTGELRPSVSTNLPVQIVAGAPQKSRQVSVTITNTTGATLSGPFTFRVYLTQGGSSAGGAALGAPVVKSLKLKPNARKTMKIKIGALPGVAEGGYYLLAVVKSPDGQMSQGPAPIAVGVTAATVGIKLAAGPTSVRSGRTAALPLTLTDTGNVPVKGSGAVTITAAPSSGGSRQTIANAVPLRVNQKQGPPRKYRLKFPVKLAKGTYTLNVSLTGLGLSKAVTATSTLVVT